MRTAWIEAARFALGSCLFIAIGCGGETRLSFFEIAGPILPDAAASDATSERPPAVRLPLHRYDFGGTGTTVADHVGGADGIAHGGAALDGRGGIVLDGQDDYIDLPNGLISRLRSGTFVVWMEWYGRICWHRIFDFGSTVQGEDIVGDATSNVFVTPLDCPGPVPLAMFGTLLDGGDTQVVVRGPVPFPINTMHQVALVVDGDTLLMELYIDAQSHGEATLRVGFDAIEDVNNWLGRSQWVQDRNLSGRYEEFRIYDVALSSSEITRLYYLGPDAL